MDTGLSSLHVAEDFDCVDGAALIRINPVLTCRKKTEINTDWL